jgi:hypothetical protein
MAFIALRLQNSLMKIVVSKLRDVELHCKLHPDVGLNHSIRGQACGPRPKRHWHEAVDTWTGL